METVRESGTVEPVPSSRPTVPPARPSWRRGVGIAMAAGAAMIGVWALVVLGASRSPEHLVDQISADRYLLPLVATAFGVQVALLAELRRRRRVHRSALAAGATGTGASSVGMVACCAHHLADLLPFVGAGAAATFLYEYRLPFVLGGLGINALGIFVAARRLRAPISREEVEPTCALG